MKRKIYQKLIVFVICILMSSNASAGTMVEVDGKKMYKTEDGTYAKDTFVWIDDNNDNIAEIYRFDKDGYLATDYTHYDGKKTNELGQLLNDGNVIKKYVSNNKIIKVDVDFIGPTIPSGEIENYLNLENSNKNKVIITEKEDTQKRRKLLWNLTEEEGTLPYDEAIDGAIINNTNIKYDPLSDVVAESGVIYSKGVGEEIILNEGEKLIPGKDAINFISSSSKFKKDVEEAIIFNGDKWTHCMELSGHKSKVKFTLNKYNYMYFEVSNENHTNENYRREFDASLLIYADDELIEEIDDFMDTDPQVVELDLDNKKTVELRINVRTGNLSERVYIRNAKFRKIKDDD